MSSKNKTSAAKQEAMPALLPKLRFPEFRAAPPWENKLIGHYLEDCSGRVPPNTKLPIYSSTREGLKRQDAYFDGRVLQNKNEYGLVPPGCFVYRHMSDDGLFKFNLNETGDEIAVSKEYPVFSTKGLNPRFLLAKLNDGPDFKHFALKQKAGGTRTRLYFSRLCEWRTLLPSPAEQQKIADCLESVDILIAAQARKVDALKTYKKGLMQQLFPREGEIQPRLRFPEFQSAGEWRNEKLISLSSEPLSNGVFNDPKKVGSGYKVINVSDMYIETTIDESRLTLLELSSSDFAANQVITGDIFFTRSSLVKSGIAVSNIYLGSSNDVTYDGHLIRFRPNISKVAPLFAHYLFKTEPIRAQLIARGKTATMTTIGQADVASVTLFYPDKAEQEHIASCLSSLDALITAETQKLEALKTHKKGLMQMLFPSLDEAEA